MKSLTNVGCLSLAIPCLEFVLASGPLFSQLGCLDAEEVLVTLLLNGQGTWPGGELDGNMRPLTHSGLDLDLPMMLANNSIRHR